LFSHPDQSVYRTRNKTIPPLPKSIKFEIPAAYSSTSSDEKIIFFDHLYSKQTKRIIAFASPMQLRKLFSSKLICMDGTFSICPKKFKQLLIIQTIDQYHYEGKKMFVHLLIFLSRIGVLFFMFSFYLFVATPVVFALLNDKKAYTYRLLFKALKRKAKEMKMRFEPDRIISDFESGMISTVKEQVSGSI
jgi:hypothetical protein